MEPSTRSPLVPPQIPAWATGALYEIVVPSFMDSDGDGLGDLRGVISRLDYLQWLGVSAIWLSPIYPSPMIDMGYDVADYCDVNPQLGSLANFDELLREAHARGLHVVLDFVPNHTSDQHPWFQQARSARNHPKRDWYIWRDGAPRGGPPNNWTNQYEISDWMWDEATGQYYMHSFTPEQPDLNWASPGLRAAMADVMRFWLDRGVDGFRIDAMVHLHKDPLFRDNPPAPDSSVDQWPAWNMLPAFTQDLGGLQEIVREICQVVDEYPGRIVIGENHLPPERLMPYYSSGVTHPANSQLLELEWDPLNVRRMVDRYEGFLTDRDWPNWILGSHDNMRIGSHLGPDRARVAAMLQHTLRGTPIMYYGEEIGMHNVDVPPEREVDVLAKRLPGKGRGRDVQRTPMQWSDDPNAGFSTAEPWLPVADDFRQVNVRCQRDDPASMLHLYRRLLALRRANDAIRTGRYFPDVIDNRVLVFRRQSESQQAVVALNFTDEPVEIRPQRVRGNLLLSTCLDRDDEAVEGTISLRANEGVVIGAAN